MVFTSSFIELVFRLRTAGLKIDIESVSDVLRTLSSGHGVGSPEPFRTLCRALWVRSEHQREIFDLIYDHCRPARRETDTAAAAETTLQNFEPPMSAPSTESEGSSLDYPHDEGSHEFVLQALRAEDEIDIYAMSTVQYSSRDYLPVSRHQTKQSWRYLRRMVRQGPRVEIDVDGTLSEWASSGIIADPILMPRRTNLAELIILIDVSASMVAFHDLGRRLLETARAGQFRVVRPLYFNNVIERYLFSDFGLSDGATVQEVLKSADIGRTYAVVFSDGGAARGNLSAAIEKDICFPSAVCASQNASGMAQPSPNVVLVHHKR